MTALPLDVSAQGNRYWNGNGGNGLWNWNNNWWGGAPVAGDRAWFEDNDTPLVTTNNTGVNLNWVSFTAGATSDRTINSGINLTDWSGAAGKIQNDSTGTHTINGGVVLNGGNVAYEINPVSGNLIINGGVNANNAGKAINFYGGNTVTINDGITGSAANPITLQAGSGDVKVILNGTSTYTGNTSIDRGTLTIGGSISSSSMVFLGNGGNANNATLVLSNTTTFGNALQINTGNGTRTVQKVGANAQTMGGAITNNKASTFNVSDSGGALTASGVISGAGSITKTGSGTLVLSGASSNSISGGFTVSSGTLIFNKNAGVNAAGSGNITIDAGGTIRTDAANQTATQLVTVNGIFNMNNNSQQFALAGAGTLQLGSGSLTNTNTGNDTFSGKIEGSGGNLVKAGAGIFNLTSTTSDFTGSVTISGGSLTINNDRALGAVPGAATADKLVIGNAQLGVTTTTTIDSGRGITLTSANSTIDTFGGGTVTYNGIMAGSGTHGLNKSGTGTLILGGANTYTGATTISNGAIRAANATSFGTAAGGVNVLSGAAAELSGGITIGAESITLNGDGIGSGGSLRNISGANTWQGGISNNTGARIMVDSGTLTVSGNITNADTTLYVGGVSNSTFSGTLTGSRTTGDGSLFKDGVGTLTLGGNNSSLSGNVLVRAGTLRATSTGAFGGGTVQIGNGSTTTTVLIETNGTRSGAITVVSGSSAGVINVASGLSYTNTGGLTGGADNTTKFGKDGAGTLVLGGTGTYGGQIQVGQGTIVATTSTALGTNSSTTARGIDLGLNVGDTATANNVAVLAANGATISNSIFVADNTSSATRTIGLSGNGTNTFNNEMFLSGNLTISAGSLATDLVTVSGNIVSNNVAARGIIKTGAGTLALSGNNTFTGDLNIGEGTVSVGAANNLGAGTITISNNGALSTSAGFTAGRAITMGTGGGTINVSANGFTNTAGLNGSGALLKTGTGTLVLSGTAGTYNGTATIGGGTLVANTALSSAAVVISNTGTLMGSSTLGAVTVKSGGVISPGNSPGNLSVSALTLEGGGSYLWEITDATAAAGTGWDVITVGGGAGTITLSANSGSRFTINVVGSSPSNFSAGTSRTWDIIDAGSWSSAFSADAFTINTNNFSATGTLGTWSVQDSSGNLRLVYTASVSDYNVTVDSGSADQGAATGGTNLFTGSVGVNKLGAGTLVMTNPLNDYTGVTTIKAGTVSVNVNAPTNSAGALGNNTNAVVVGDTVAAAAAGFNFAAAVTNDHGLNIAAGTGVADRTIGTTIGSGTAVQAGAITLSTNATFTAASGGALAVSGVISGAGSATILGAGGTVDFTGNNTGYAGTTMLSSGTLRVGNNNALGTGGLTLNGGRLASASGTGYTLTNAITVGADVGFGQASGGTGALTLSGALGLGASTRSFDVSNSTTLSGIISGSAGVGLTKTGNGTLTISGANTYTGTTTVNGGVLTVSNGSAIGDTNVVTITSGTLNLATGETVGSIGGGGNIALNGNQLIAGQNNSNTEFSGIMSSSSTNGNFVKKGGGTLTLSGANTMNGPMYLVGGTTLFTINQGATFTNTLFLGEESGTDNVTLAFGGSGLTIANAINARSGSSNNTLVIDAVNSTGTTTLNGALTLAKNTTIRANSGGSLLVNGNVSLGTSQLFADSSTGSSLTIAGAISANTNRAGELLVNDTGTVVLTGNNSADMKITLTAGTLQVGSITNLGAPTGTFFGDKLNINGGTLSATNNVSAGANFGVTVSANGGNLHASSGSTLTLADFINDSGAGTNAYTLGIGGGGTVALQKATGNNQFNGNMTFSVTNGSTLSTPNLLALGNSSTNIVSLNNGTFAYTGGTGTASQRFTLGAGGGTISVTAANLGTTLTLTNIVSGTGNTLTKAGDSILSLSGANTYGRTVISGGMLTVGADNNLGSSPGVTTSDSITIGSGRLGLNGSFTLGANRGITLTNANAGIDVYGGNTATVAGVITGAGGLTKFGTGTMILTAANSYEGGTTVGVGVLRATAANSLGAADTAVTVSNGATLELSNATGFTMNRGLILSGNGTNGGALLNSAGANTNSGGLTLAAASRIAVSGGSLLLSGNITNGGNLLSLDTFGLSGTPLTIGGAISGDGALQKIGGGTAILSGANSYNGTTLISAGVLQVGNGAGTGQLGAGSVTNNASLVVNRTGELTLANAISGTGSLTKQAAGTLTLSASNSFQGGSTLSAGVIRAAHANALGTGSLSASADTVLQVTNSINIANNLSVYSVRFLNGGNTLSGTITNNNTVYDVISGQTNTISGFMTGSGGVELIGGGTLNITGTTNNYTGNTVISNGTLQISTLANSNTVSSIGVSNNVTLAGTNASNAVIDYTGGNVTTDRAFVFNGVATNGEGGTLNISNSSTVVTMTGSASGTGKMIVDGGTLVLSNTSTSDSFAPTSIQVESGATLQLAANNQIGNTTGLILNGGTFLVGGANVIESLGTLTLTTDSTIDFGNFGQTGFRQLAFANSNSDTTGITWVGTLTITNWQGVALTTSDFTEIVFGVGGLTSTQLGQIRFANQDINGGTLIGGGELVPVPEPRVYAAAIALLATIGWRERKRLVGLVRRKR
jgi:autotransporter-associated beta strand protein